MKIKLAGVTSRDEIISAIDKTIDFLGVDFEKHCLNGVNIYFNVYEKGGGVVTFVDNDGDEIDSIKFSSEKKTKKISGKLKGATLK